MLQKGNKKSLVIKLDKKDHVIFKAIVAKKETTMTEIILKYIQDFIKQQS